MEPGPDRRMRLMIRGAVQGVGFRPFVYRLAAELGLHGWIRNSASGVCVEIEGTNDSLALFRESVVRAGPPRAAVHALDCTYLDPAGYDGFSIRESESHGTVATLMMPDIATCPDCLREIHDPRDRRYRYPFTNCTNCGPRFSIIESLPYDRAGTTMKRFRMCAACDAEYRDPRDRRFHAQPNACAECGPRLELLDPSGARRCAGDEALLEAIREIRHARIVAIKGIGGFHLFVNAADDDAVRRLRLRKNREEKPLAVMVGGMEQARALCSVSATEEALLLSPAAPIVLLDRRAESVAPSVAPRNPSLGVMFPATPLHHLLLAEVDFPLVATSGNRSDEPICTENAEALVRLGDIADAFLVHDRPIARRMDDSIVRVMVERPMMLRRARGYAPLPITVGITAPTVAVGAHMKNTTAITVGDEAILSQHIGDLETPEALDAFCRSIADLKDLYGLRDARVVCDLHPDYSSTGYADRLCASPLRVQHHYAHALACLCDNELSAPALAVVWDGTGYGMDGTIWGGEFLSIGSRGFERVAHLRTFRLPGGDSAVREPRRAALGVLFELFGERTSAELGFRPAELAVLHTMLRKDVNAPRTSSAGRLFDAVAAIIGLRGRSSFEGQAAMELEFAAEPCDESYAGVSTDWESIVRGVLDDLRRGVSAGRISARFHNSLVEIIVGVAERAGEHRILLTGGCFQNAFLMRRSVRRLREAGFAPYWHQRVPPNDGGIALGQLVAAARE